MTSYIYNISDGSLAEWLSVHSDCEHLILKGTVTAASETLQQMNAAIIQSKIKLIDVADFHILANTENHEDYGDRMQKDPYFCLSYGWGDGYDGENSTLGLLEHAVANQDYSPRFLWNGQYLLSEDRCTLAFALLTDDDKNANGDMVAVIPETVVHIGRYAFIECESLSNIEVRASLKTIDDGAFFRCCSLDFSLPDSLEKLGFYAFAYCYGMRHITIPPKIDVIPIGCFAISYEIKLDSLSHVKRIEEAAFDNLNFSDVTLPEGILYIGAYNFTGVKFIHLPASLVELDRKFYQDSEWEMQKVPYVDVAHGNKYFYEKKGTLYRVDEDAPYLGEEFTPVQESKAGKKEEDDSLLVNTSRFVHERTYSLEELTTQYYSVAPINKNQTMFLVWNGKERYNNIVDQYGNEYFNKGKVSEIHFSFDHFILVDHKYVYPIDMKELLLNADLLEYEIDGCDNDGRLYVRIGDQPDEFYKDLYANDPPPQCWCIDVQGNPLFKKRYENLGRFDSQGFAPACVGKKWGVIDTSENVVIPFLYKAIGDFDSHGIAIVQQGSKKGYINRRGELVVPIRYNLFYREFGDADHAYAIIDRGREKGEYFVDRKGQVIGTFSPRSNHDRIYYSGFHIFHRDGLWGYCKQFSNDFSGCIFKDIRVVDDYCIEVSLDGAEYQRIDYFPPQP